MSKLSILCICFLAAATLIPTSHASSANYGSDFYVGSMRNFGGGTISYKFYMSTLSESSIDYTIKNYNGDAISSGSLSRNDPKTVAVSTSYVTNSNSFSERNEGLHISSTGPISVLVVNFQSATISEYPAYPKQTFPLLQYEYYTASPATSIVSSARSEILLVGTEDGTVVTITPTTSVSIPSDIQDVNSPVETVSAGQTKVVTLNRLQTLYFGVNGNVDLTGTSIVSNKPLTVISGHECANVPSSQAYCEHVEEQIPPTVTWGKKHLLRSYGNKNDFSYFLVVSSEPDTLVKHNCGGTSTSFMLTLAGHKNTFKMTYDGNCYLEADKAILITQMMTGGQVAGTGDPAISVIPPVDHYTNQVIFHTPQFDQNLESNHINILIQKQDTLILDGNSLSLTWSPIMGLNNAVVGYSAKVNDLSIAVHEISSMGGTPFHVLVYGYTSSSLAGYSFSAGVGILKQLARGPLQLKPWYGNILGGVSFIVNGPNFVSTDVITCQFNEISLPCQYVDESHAMCVSPRLTFTRHLTVRLFINGEKYLTDSRFYSLSINDDTKVSILENQRFVTSTQTITLVWNPMSIFPNEAGIEPSLLLVDIMLYDLKGQNDNIVEMISQVATGIPNTGQATVTIPVMQSDDHITEGAFSLTVYDGPNNQTVLTSLNASVTLWCTDLWVIFVLPHELDDLLFNQCNKWIESEPLSIGDVLLARTSNVPCPPTKFRADAPNSGLVLDTQTYLLDYFHDPSGSCYRQRSITGANEGSGNECCYNAWGNLIVKHPYGGSINKYDPRASDFDFWTTIKSHFVEDVVPYLFCCRGKKQNCLAYYQRRPSDDGSRYRPPVPACVYGDPHIVTLDLHKYTFNGKGEFILVETPNFDPSFTLHARMEPVKNEDNEDGKATVFTAIVAQQGDSDTVQFELQGSGDEIKLMTYVNGEEVDFSELTTQEFANVTVTDTGNNTLNAGFSTGAYITVTELNGLISTLIVYLPDMYRNRTRGLMGNYNNDTSDDLMRKDQDMFLSLNSGLQLIHDWFGMSFIISTEEEGIFSYNNGDSFNTYYDPNFIPLFEATFETQELEDMANEICGNDEFCKFDIAVSGRTDIGESTKQGGTDFEMLQEISQPVVCDPPCENGACVDTNVCSCSEGYMGQYCNQTNMTACDSYNPCQNGATCGAIGGSPMCTCAQGYIGYYCENINPDNPPIVSTTSTSVVPTDAVTTTTTTVSTSTRGGESTSSTSSTETVRPTETTERFLGFVSNGAAVGIIVAIVVIVAVVILAFVVLAIVLISKRRSSVVKKYPIENEMAVQDMGKANPAYAEHDDEKLYDDIQAEYDDDDDEKKLVN